MLHACLFQGSFAPDLFFSSLNRPLPSLGALHRLDAACSSGSVSSAAAPSRQRSIASASLAVSSGGAGSVQRLTITRPDDWHLHVRDGDSLRAVVPHTASHFGRAIIMPNLVPPVTTTDLVRGRTLWVQRTACSACVNAPGPALAARDCDQPLARAAPRAGAQVQGAG